MCVCVSAPLSLLGLRLTGGHTWPRADPMPLPPGVPQDGGSGAGTTESGPALLYLLSLSFHTELTALLKEFLLLLNYCWWKLSLVLR